MKKLFFVLIIQAIAHGSLIGGPLKGGVSANKNDFDGLPQPTIQNANHPQPQKSTNTGDEAIELTDLNFIKTMLAQKYRELNGNPKQSQEQVENKVEQNQPNGAQIKNTMKDYQKKLMQMYNQRQKQSHQQKTENNIDNGKNNKIKGKMNMIDQGQGNNIDGTRNHISGNHNVVKSSKNLVFGSGNVISQIPDEYIEDFKSDLKFDFGQQPKDQMSQQRVEDKAQEIVPIVIQPSPQKQIYEKAQDIASRVQESTPKNRESVEQMNTTALKMNKNAQTMNQTCKDTSQKYQSQKQESEQQKYLVATKTQSPQPEDFPGNATKNQSNLAKTVIANNAHANSVVSNNWQQHSMCTILLLALILVLSL